MKITRDYSFQPSKTQRAIGVLAAFSISMTLCFCLMSVYPFVPKQMQNSGMLLRFFAITRQAETALTTGNDSESKHLSTQNKGRNSAPQKNAQATASTFEIIKDVETPSDEVPKPATDESPANNWRQQYAGKAVQAYADSRSDIQKMADAKGVNLRAVRATKYEAFQTAAANAAIPDCLENGASSKLGLDTFTGLLRGAALAVSAARGKCK